MDYDALAKQFGGQVDAEPDYASLASQFGGQVEEPAAPRFDAVDEPTAFDDFLVKFGNTAVGKQLSGAFGGNMRGSAVGRTMQGMADPDVPYGHAVRLMEHLSGDDVVLTMIRDGDHRLSRPQDIAKILEAAETLARGR